MRKNLSILMGLAVALGAGLAMAADFEGEVDMKVNRLNSKDQLVEYFVKGHKGRFHMDSNDGKYSGSGIYDWKTNQVIMLMDQQKMYMVTQVHPEKFHSENKNHFKITDTGKNETILGYRCEEWDYTADAENGKIWLTPGIGNWWANEMMAQYDKLPSDQRALAQVAMEKKLFPMKWESTDSSNNYRNGGEVVKIKRESLDESLFEVPADYKKFDMGNMFGGGGQDPLGSAARSKLPF